MASLAVWNGELYLGREGHSARFTYKKKHPQRLSSGLSDISVPSPHRGEWRAVGN